jgi:hypothetical protein
MDDEATAEVAAYVYTPLSQPQGIRVATLLPGVKTDPLRVSIHEHGLNDTPFNMKPSRIVGAVYTALARSCAMTEPSW